MTIAPLLIHPGFHKTGTTFLQNAIFSNPAFFHQPWRRPDIDAALIRPNALHFNAGSARRALADSAQIDRAGVATVLSEEALSGNPFNGAREAVEFANRLSATFPNAKILFTVRRQAAMLRSIYTQYLKAGGRLSLGGFLDQPTDPEFFKFDPSFVKYHLLVEYYAKLFGTANVLVLPQEYLQRDQAGFLDALISFVGSTAAGPLVPVRGAGHDNISPPASSIPWLRAANRLRRSPFNETGRPGFSLASRALASVGYRQHLLFKNAERDVMAVIADRFAGQFAESNVALQRFVPVALSDYGYELPRAS